jgi:hypothetical protein
MSYVMAAPEMLAAAAADLATIDSSLSAAHTAAATQTVALVPAAADEVSASIAHLFSQRAEGYQAVAGQAAAFHEQFIQHLNASACSYASTEAANTSSLRSLGANTPGSRASANTEALPPINVSFKELRDLLFLLLLPFAIPLALAWLLLLLIAKIQQSLGL